MTAKCGYMKSLYYRTYVIYTNYTKRTGYPIRICFRHPQTQQLRRWNDVVNRLRQLAEIYNVVMEIKKKGIIFMWLFRTWAIVDFHHILFVIAFRCVSLFGNSPNPVSTIKLTRVRLVPTWQTSSVPLVLDTLYKR